MSSGALAEPPVDTGARRRALFATAATLGVAAMLELVVYGHGGHDALGDIPGRFFAWHVHPSLLPYAHRPIEYPVVVGYLTWITSWFGHGAAGFFIANGLVAVLLALTMTLLLQSSGRHRIWRWAAGLPLALYAFHNWDLAVMVPAVAGLMAFEAGRDRASGALLAVGASAKVFPALFLPPLAVVRWHSGDRRGAARLGGAFLLTTLALNAPVALGSWSTWTFPATFQGARAATWGTLWFWLLRAPGLHLLVAGHLRVTADLLAIVTLVGALGAISLLATRRHLSAAAIGAAVVGVFLLSNKVYSPNYDLWIVPFFVLLPLPRRTWVAFCAADLGIFVLVYGHLHGNWSSHVVMLLLAPLVALRALTIVAVIACALRGAESKAGPAATRLGTAIANGTTRRTPTSASGGT